jgi:hypothetical protein
MWLDMRHHESRRRAQDGAVIFSGLRDRVCVSTTQLGTQRHETNPEESLGELPNHDSSNPESQIPNHDNRSATPRPSTDSEGEA